MSKKTPFIAALSFALSSAEDGALQLFPAGEFDAKRGALRGKGPWRINAESAARLIAAVSQRENDIMVDYDHGLLLAPPAGGKAIAAGWIGSKSLEWRDAPHDKPGLYAAAPDWTAAAAAHIDAKEYRYLSPLFTYDGNTGEVTDIINVALTNNPAIDDMKPVTLAAASALLGLEQSTTTEPPMDKLLALLGLPADADQTAACTAITALQAQAAEHQTQIAALSAQATQTAAPDMSEFVPIGMYTEAVQKLAALSGDSLESKVAQLVEDGVKTGKLIGDEAKKWATEFGKKDLAALSAYLNAMPGIAALSGMQTDGKKPVETAALSATPEQEAVAKQLGIDVKTMIGANK